MEMTNDGRPPLTARSRILNWLRTERYTLFAAVLCGVALSVAVNLWYPPLYRSTVVLYLDEPFRPATEEAAAVLMMPSDGLRRLRHEAVSHALLKGLSGKYDLGQHYGLPDDQNDRDARVITILRDRIDVQLNEDQSLEISVSDRDRHMAMLLARDIHFALDKNMEDRILGQLRRTSAIYDKLSTDMVKEADKERIALSRSLGVPRAAGTTHVTDPDLLELAAAGARLNAASEELSHLRLAQKSAMTMASKEHLPRLLLVQEALPDLRSDPFRDGLVRSLLIIALAMALTTALRLFWFHYRAEGRAAILELLNGAGDGERAPHPAPRTVFDGRGNGVEQVKHGG